MSAILRWTTKDLDALARRRGTDPLSGQKAGDPTPRKRIRLPKALLENKLERDYWEILRLKVFAGELKWAQPKAITLTFPGGKYTADFLVIPLAGKPQVHETKGYLYRKDAVRFKQAIMAHPWLTFVLVEKVNGAWTTEVYDAPAQ